MVHAMNTDGSRIWSIALHNIRSRLVPVACTGTLHSPDAFQILQGAGDAAR